MAFISPSWRSTNGVTAAMLNIEGDGSKLVIGVDAPDSTTACMLLQIGLSGNNLASDTITQQSYFSCSPAPIAIGSVLMYRGVLFAARDSAIMQLTSAGALSSTFGTTQYTFGTPQLYGVGNYLVSYFGQIGGYVWKIPSLPFTSKSAK
jgi:hypothetical protein